MPKTIRLRSPAPLARCATPSVLCLLKSAGWSHLRGRSHISPAISTLTNCSFGRSTPTRRAHPNRCAGSWMPFASMIFRWYSRKAPSRIVRRGRSPLKPGRAMAASFTSTASLTPTDRSRPIWTCCRLRQRPFSRGFRMSDTPGIEVAGLTVTYRNGFTALRDANFTVPQASVTALVGVNGAGKSTLFKALMGFVPAAAGKVRVLGMAVPQALRQNLIAYVPQAEEVDWTFPVLVEDVVMMGRYGHMGFLRRARPEDRRAVDEALSRVNMQDFRHRQIGEL